jgi:hypothetical protein
MRNKTFLHSCKNARSLPFHYFGKLLKTSSLPYDSGMPNTLAATCPRGAVCLLRAE